ncbi:hypothetical protein F4813DRAFT_18926 [Daldinia decipiens]|uniref:uncharacterized protein n=1 Tax=Daldinia decipiens TaxID=326647 RepID=UPI0020C39C9E|nr:uncharacterized protein F4813DRAFT_18926 [Daldinia decipiens]KAI1663056.1 hypothetical protein F4813DRAFT_18926 [Daldinia decipiens]
MTFMPAYHLFSAHFVQHHRIVVSSFLLHFLISTRIGKKGGKQRKRKAMDGWFAILSIGAEIYHALSSDGRYIRGNNLNLRVYGHERASGQIRGAKQRQLCRHSFIFTNISIYLLVHLRWFSFHLVFRL